MSASPRPVRRTIRSLVSVGLAGMCLVLVAACGEDGDGGDGAATAPVVSDTVAASTSTSASTSTAASTSTSSTVAPLPSMRGDRYCEVLLPRPGAEGVTVEVYNSYRLNECPAEVWSALDPAVVAAEQGAPLALLNGPRFWLMDRVEKQQEEGGFTVVDFGGIEMNLLATVSIASVQAASVPYTPNAVSRSSVFTYDAGSTVYELTNAAGERFVMQSWSQQVDPSLVEADLAGLGDRLALPAGWAFSSRVLDEPLDLVTLDAPAQVLQDELRNSYSLVVG